MNTKVRYKGNDYTLLAGMNKAVSPLNGDSYTKAMTIENNTNKDGRVIGVVLRYKGEIDDVCIEFKTSKTKSNPPISGDLALAVLGSKISPNFSTPAFQVFPFPGDGILITKNLAIEIHLKTWAIAVPERSVMIALLMEELDDSKEVVQKK